MCLPHLCHAHGSPVYGRWVGIAVSTHNMNRDIHGENDSWLFVVLRIMVRVSCINIIDVKVFSISALCFVYVAAETEGRRRIISKSFHHQLRYHDKQPLVGPPESMREHVIAATHAMRKGDWKKCRDYVLDIKVCEIFGCV